jgi:hypothetical protein
MAALFTTTFKLVANLVLWFLFSQFSYASWLCHNATCQWVILAIFNVLFSFSSINRRMFGGRKLWDAKDDQAWVHDRFEEMNLQDDRYEVIAHDL